MLLALMPYRWQGIGLLSWDWWVSGAESAIVSILENAKADVTCEQGFTRNVVAVVMHR